MAGAPKISIVMPVRNAAGTLRVALESVRSQTFQDWELVTVDDGSKDETAEILAAAARTILAADERAVQTALETVP